ncbi:MAG TPA: alpha/beta hydrolase [Candidatus Nanopelagicales bacterium]|nr:alpha/beta hydrolase [Candidatus Nanopelagicales bacterium]
MSEQSEVVEPARPRVGWLTWVVRVVCPAALVVVAAVLVTAWPVVVHGHPAYAIALGTAATLAALVGVRAWRNPQQPTGWRAWLRGALVVLSLVGVGALWWLTPFVAVQPALAAMESDSAVTVDEYPTQIVMTPTRTVSATAVFFQPGARVDARAYAAVLRPLAEAGHRVVISKQPFGIAFFNTTAFSSAQAAYPDVVDWVVGGHSLGGTVACIDAESHDSDAEHPVRGLLLYASYPATDMSTSLTAAVLSISGSRDGLATPAKIDAAKPLLPEGTDYQVIEGAVHAYFGDYGPQPGDGTPAISHDDARTRIGDLSVAFVNGRPA